MSSPRKNPAAVALGRRGGKANTPAQLEARRANAKRGGRPSLRGEPASERVQLYLTKTEMAAVRAAVAKAGPPWTVSSWCVDVLRKRVGLDD